MAFCEEFCHYSVYLCTLFQPPSPKVYKDNAIVNIKNILELKNGGNLGINYTLSYLLKQPIVALINRNTCILGSIECNTLIRILLLHCMYGKRTVHAVRL